MPESSRSWNGLRLLAGTGLVALTAFFAGEPFWSSADAQTEREAFRSGAARSEDVLKEIAVILKRMDQRLERIEKVVADGKSPGQDAK